MTNPQKVTQEEREGVLAFLRLPLNLQGQLWHLLTRRSQMTISILECLSNGPRTYEEIAELLDMAKPTIMNYCSVFLKPFPVKLDVRYQTNKYGHRICYRTLQLVEPEQLYHFANVKSDRAS